VLQLRLRGRVLLILHIMVPESLSSLIYLDHNATTPVSAGVLEVMLPYFSVHFGNAASTAHQPGRIAAEAVAHSRQQVAGLLGSEPGEIYFTSGSTESANLALQGVSKYYATKGKHMISWETEHPSVLDTLNHLRSTGMEITLLPVDRSGRPDPALLQSAIRTDTILVCTMLANNETGVTAPIRELSEIAHRHGALFCCDATQGAGKMRIDVNELGADLLFISAHKMYGPKGTGALFIRRKNPRVTLAPLLFGGGHENGIRPGTLNVPCIAGLGAAAARAQANQWDEANRMSQLRTRLEQLLTDVPGVFVNGDIRNRIPNTTNLLIKDIRSSDLLKHTSQLAYSFGSACASAKPEPSHVLKAMGLTDEEAYASIRLSLGKDTTKAQIETAAEIFISAIGKLRE
jgi:cysteine desulfurase